MSAFESGYQDPTTQAIYDVIDTMNGETAINPDEAGSTLAVHAEMQAMEVQEFGPYRRSFATYSKMTKPDEKAAGAAFSEGVAAILKENDAPEDEMAGGHELRCRGMVNGRERRLVVSQTKAGTHVVFTTDDTGSGERYSYLLGSEGEVRRVDRQARSGPEEAINRRAKEETNISTRSTREEKAAAVLAMIRQAREFHEKLILDARMGTNNLPVGPEEIAEMLADVREIVKHQTRQA